MLSKKEKKLENRIVGLEKELKAKMKKDSSSSALKTNSIMSKLEKGSQQKLSMPVSEQLVMTKTQPLTTFKMEKGRVVSRVRHREFVQDIGGNASTDFQVWFAPRINPGSGSLFPWLASIADRFEKYRFNKLCFEYRTALGSQANGKVMLSVDFDVLDVIPTTKQAIGQQSVMAEGPVWSNYQLDIPSKLLVSAGEKYVAAAVNGTQVVNGADMKTYDVGRFCVSTAGVLNVPKICGELWVEYDVELITPTNPPFSGNAVGGNSSLGIAFTSINPFSQQGNVYVIPILNGNTFRCGVNGEYKIVLVFFGASLTGLTSFTLTSSFSSDSVIQSDTNFATSTAAKVVAACSARLREGDIVTVGLPGGTTSSYTLYCFEFPYP